MDIADFNAGSQVLHHHNKNYQYKSFTPALINHAWKWQEAKINTLLENATKELAELNAFSFLTPDIDLFIQMHIIKEAQTSSQIEGTKTEMEEAVLEKELIIPERRDDWEEVQNYIKAMNFAIKKLVKLPLSNRLLKETHAVLMQGVRGDKKTPGEFRTSQNWIGGLSLQDAFFIPPFHTELPELLSDLEKFWHNEEIEVPHLIRIAISHYQFETIHPFLDGNGRIGRLLITLYLVSKGLLNKPSLYLSDYFNKHRSAYYEALSIVREKNNLSYWVKFFLVAVIETAMKGKNTLLEIIKLRSEVEQQVMSMGKRTKNARSLLLHLFSKPIVTINEVANYLNLTHQAANTLVKDFCELGILIESTGYQRNRVYRFQNYHDLFRV